uniref:DUF659 domain-containing protein n=1 Tax=Rhabditophanes sp. KR3021 TaxID=114890 RepID=A0AC35UBR4_9BILA
MGLYFEQQLTNDGESAEIKEKEDSKFKTGKRSKLSSGNQCIPCSKWFKTKYAFSHHRTNRLCKEPLDVAETFNSIKAKEGDEKGCWVYLMIDPRTVRRNWSKVGVKKAIRYVGETIYFGDRMTLHKSRFNHAVELRMLFDNKEDFLKEVVYDKSLGENGVIVLKKWRRILKVSLLMP